MVKVKMSDTNMIRIIGKVETEFKAEYEVCGEKFLSTKIKICRLSGTFDIVKIIVPEQLIKSDIVLGSTIEVNGEIRSANYHVGNNSHLILSVFTRNVKKVDDQSVNINKLYLYGTICKTPLYRITPGGIEITELLVAVNRLHRKSDYIPLIVWGKNARESVNLKVGDLVSTHGRFQSRIYNKTHEDRVIEQRVAYEVSCSEIEQKREEQRIWA